MEHWEVVILHPGFYSISYGSNAEIRKAAVPMTHAARYVARSREPETEMFPFADQGDMTAMRVVLIEDSQDLEVLEQQAVLLQETIEYEMGLIDCEPIAA